MSKSAKAVTPSNYLANPSTRADAGTKSRNDTRKKSAAPLFDRVTGTSDALLLGWELKAEKSANIGFQWDKTPEADANLQGDQPVEHAGEGHVLTFAPPGAGKGRGAMIPNLLRYEGSAIVIDPKGEAAKATARRRREMGQEVYILDPFAQISDKTDRLNPFDVFDLPGVDESGEAEALADLISGSLLSVKEPFWDKWGRALVAGIILAVIRTESKATQNFAKVRDYLKAADPIYGLASLLDRKDVDWHRMSEQEIGAFLNLTDVTRSGVIATAQSYMSVISSDAAASTIMDSTIDLKRLRDGHKMTIYLVMPSAKMASHSPLLRLWVSCLMTAVMSRTSTPDIMTLFMIDECAQLGRFDLLKTAFTLGRGYGMRVWALFQDLSQLQRLCMDEWQAVVNSAAVLQTFGVSNYMMARDLVSIMGGLSPEELLAMPADQAAVLIARARVKKVRLPDYLHDECFKGHWDAHSLHNSKPGNVRM